MNKFDFLSSCKVAYIFECPDCNTLSDYRTCYKCGKNLGKEHKRKLYKAYDRELR